MDLNEFIENLYTLKSLLNQYNLEKMRAGFSALYLPKDPSIDGYEKFLKWLDLKEEMEDRAEMTKTQIRIVAKRMISALRAAGLKRIDDLYELPELERLGKD